MSDLSTATMWAGWLWLCRPVLSVFGGFKPAGMQHGLTHLLAKGVPLPVERGALALFAVSIVLWLWNALSERRDAAPKTRAIPDYAAHFGLTEAQLRRCRESQTCIVHHDGEGDILAVETVMPAAPIAAVVSVTPAVQPAIPAISTPEPVSNDRRKELEIAEAA